MDDFQKQRLKVAIKQIGDIKGTVSDISVRHNMTMDEDNQLDRLTKTSLDVIMHKLNDAQSYSESVLNL